LSDASPNYKMTRNMTNGLFLAARIATIVLIARELFAPVRTK